MTVAILLLKKFWWSIPIALLFAALMLTRHTLATRTEDLKAERAASQLFADRVKLTSETIIAKALASKNRIETKQTQISTEQSHAYDDLRARYSAALDRLRTGQSGTHPGSGRDALPSASNAPGSIAPASGGAFISEADLNICATNTAKAATWQAWYKAVATIER